MDMNNQEPNNKSSSLVPKIIGALVVIAVCCACAVILAAAGLIIYERTASSSSPNAPLFPTPAINSTQPVQPPPSLFATPTQSADQLTRPPVDSISSDTLQTLTSMNVPENDPYELACRLEEKCNIAKTVQDKSYKVGDKEQFWVLNSDTVKYNQITATLLYITPHSYFWAQDGVNVNKNDMKALMDTFENKIYPTDREFFGSEWTPGVDNDPHIFVIYASGLGSNIGGGYNSTDEFNAQIQEHSNQHESFVISTGEALSDQYTYGTLAHEFVHMIQFPTDRNESSWMTEGFAEVGSFLNGYYGGGADLFYAQRPDLQLTDWSDNQSPDFGAHYGQSFLYLAYFLDRYGTDPTKYLNNNPENDLASIDDTLAHFNITNKQTGKMVTADDVFMDWAAALYLEDGSVGDGRYTYHDYANAPQTSDTNVIDNCPSSALNGTVHQYGIDYIGIHCTGDFTLHFSGSTSVPLMPENAYSGKYMFWSNKGNESDMTLTHEFDLTDVSSPVTFSYQTWYDIEKDWDYVYVEASTDGKTWNILQAPSSTNYNPSGASYGWAYTGQSNGWKQEEVDLSKYAGRKVQVRFEYVTDAEINGEGFMLDNVKVDAINYQSDFEADDGGWTANGFVRVENILPQTYRLNLIVKGDTTTVTPIEVNSDQTADVPLSLKSGEQATLIVTGTTRFTTSPAAYQIEVK